MALRSLVLPWHTSQPAPCIVCAAVRTYAAPLRPHNHPHRHTTWAAWAAQWALWACAWRATC
jgi:hypothetical protein